MIYVNETLVAALRPVLTNDGDAQKAIGFITVHNPTGAGVAAAMWVRSQGREMRFYAATSLGAGSTAYPLDGQTLILGRGDSLLASGAGLELVVSGVSV